MKENIFNNLFFMFQLMHGLMTVRLALFLKKTEFERK